MLCIGVPHTRNMCAGVRGQFAGVGHSPTMWVSWIKCRCQAVGKCSYPLVNLARSILRNMKSIFETEITTQWFYYHFLKEWTLEGRRIGGWIWEELGMNITKLYLVYIHEVLKEIIKNIIF